jgi:hypothetical protein
MIIVVVIILHSFSFFFMHTFVIVFARSPSLPTECLSGKKRCNLISFVYARQRNTAQHAHLYDGNKVVREREGHDMIYSCGFFFLIYMTLMFIFLFSIVEYFYHFFFMYVINIVSSFLLVRSINSMFQGQQDKSECQHTPLQHLFLLTRALQLVMSVERCHVVAC